MMLTEDQRERAEAILETASNAVDALLNAQPDAEVHDLTHLRKTIQTLVKFRDVIDQARGDLVKLALEVQP